MMTYNALAQWQEEHGSMEDYHPTEKENEHQMHKTEGEYYSWCEICVEEEICPKCKAAETKMKNCLECETTGRRMP